MEILMFILLLSLLCPGSKSSSGFEFIMIPVVIICVGLVLAVLTGVIWIGKSVAISAGEDLAGIAAGFAALGSLLTANFFIAGWDIRRCGGTP